MLRDWEFCRKVEGVLCIQQSLATSSQNENRFNGAFTGPIKQRTRNKLMAPTIDLANLDRWVKHSNPPRVAKAVVDLTENGNICRKRALLECERRFFCNEIEVPFDEDDIEVSKRIKFSNREKGQLLLDLRTCLACHFIYFLANLTCCFFSRIKKLSQYINGKKQSTFCKMNTSFSFVQNEKRKEKEQCKLKLQVRTSNYKNQLQIKECVFL